MHLIYILGLLAIISSNKADIIQRASVFWLLSSKEDNKRFSSLNIVIISSLIVLVCKSVLSLLFNNSLLINGL